MKESLRPIEPGRRTCAVCKMEKPLTDFYRDRGSPLGRKYRCKQCDRAASSRWKKGDGIEWCRNHHRTRTKTEARRALMRRSGERQRLKFPERKAAYDAVRYALKTGKLKREACSRCGSEDKAEAHHEDYARKLDVTWLCQPCHNEAHNR